MKFRFYIQAVACLEVVRSASLLLLFSVILILAPTLHSAPQQEIDIPRAYDPNGWPRPVPVSISGFSGEVDSVLKNDLLFMGVENVSPDRAQYLISGSNAGRVEGRVVARLTKNQILAKAYSGGTL